MMWFLFQFVFLCLRTPGPVFFVDKAHPAGVRIHSIIWKDFLNFKGESGVVLIFSMMGLSGSFPWNGMIHFCMSEYGCGAPGKRFIE